MDSSQRANAAQLAARNIKQAKPKSRRPGGTTRGAADSQVPQWAPMPSQDSGGGLFGGSVQNGGSFSFAPPAGGPSFPPATFGTQSQSFGSSSPDVSDSEGRFEGDNRGGKRQFGTTSSSQQSSSFPSFGQSQAGNPFASANQPPSSGSGIFLFGGSQPQSSSGLSFNSSLASSAPSNNPFSFGGGSSQPTNSIPSIDFGSAPSENKATSAPYSFGGQQNQAQGGNSLFNFNSTPQEKPANAPFLFGQTSTQTTGSGISFNSIPASAIPSNNFEFGSAPAAAPSSSGISFGASTSTAPSAPLFNFNSTSAVQPHSNSIFGVAQSTDAPQTTNIFASKSLTPSSSLFTNLNAPASPSNNLFGKLVEAPASTNTILEGQTQTQTSSSIFGQGSRNTATPNIFAEKKVEMTPNNIFGNNGRAPATNTVLEDQKSLPATNNIFGSFNKSAPGSLFGSQNQQPAPINSPFSSFSKDSSSTSDLFGNLNKPVDSSVTQPKINSTNHVTESSPVESTSASDASFSRPFAQPPPLFSAPSTSPTQLNRADKPAFSFASAQPSVTQSPPKNNIFSPLKPVDAPAAASQPPPNGMFPSLQQSIPSPQKTSDASGLPPNRQIPVGVEENDPIIELVATRSISDEQIRKRVPADFSEDDTQKFFATYRITCLNKAMQSLWGTIGLRDPTPVFSYYNEERNLILNHYTSILKNLKRKSSGDPQDESSSKRPKHGGQATLAEPLNNRVASEDGGNQSPTKRDPQAHFSSSTSNNISGSSFLAPASALGPLNPVNLTGASGQNAANTSFSNGQSSKSKRKASEELTQNTEQLSPLRREMKTPKLNGVSTPRSGSQTSQTFKSILESPSESNTPQKSPPKRLASPEKLGDEAPRFNPFGTLPVPKSPIKSTAPTPAATANPFASLTTPTPSVPGNPFPVKHTPSGSNSNDQKGPVFKMPTINPSTNFLAQFGAQAKKSEEDEEAAKLQRAKDEDMDSDDDEAEFEAEWREKRAAEKKELEEIAKTGAKFRFGTSATKAMEHTSSSSKPFEAAVKPSNGAGTKPLFGPRPSSQGSGTSVFSSINGSGTSTPGPFGSSSGSVLDGHAPGKAVPISNNIFGHLSDADSGKGDDGEEDSAESGAEDDSEKKDSTYKLQTETGSDTQPEKTAAGIASSRKSNMFSLGANSTFGASSGTSSPGGSLFGRVSKDSKKDDESAEDKDDGGTRTPGGSLFDRITKDGNGNPVRHISTEEKENTQPSSGNIFADMKNPFSSSFNKTSAPSDHTWKPDSPIRFGTATTNSTSGVTIDVSAATPTKSGSPPSLFGAASSAPTSSPFSGLFGNKVDTKSQPSPSLFGTSSSLKTASNPVGFQFGSPFGVASSPASLIPSAAGSATTSRATTPGATTDGESGGDADPDAERHEQIDLTAVGPGEENEEIVHEVRAKALKLVPQEEGSAASPWQTKGVGPLRILKHKETNVTRVLMRADPSGTIVLNNSILNIPYGATAKTVKLLTAMSDGKGMETFILQVKTSEAAQKLADMFEANKASS